MSDEIRIQLPWRVQAFTKMVDTGDYSVELSDGVSYQYLTIKAEQLKERRMTKLVVGDIWLP